MTERNTKAVLLRRRTNVRNVSKYFAHFLRCIILHFYHNCFSRNTDVAHTSSRQLSSDSQLSTSYLICRLGWLIDGTVRYPIIFPRGGCGTTPPGIRGSSNPQNKANTYDVYCFKETGNPQFQKQYETILDKCLLNITRIRAALDKCLYRTL